MNWISCKEKLPPSHKFVLTWFEGEALIMSYSPTHDDEVTGVEDPCWLPWYLQFEHITKRYVTHWMPLPGPPEEEK